MNKKYLINILKKLGFGLIKEPLLLNQNLFNAVFEVYVERNKSIIIKIDLTGGQKEKKIGFNKNRLKNEAIFLSMVKKDNMPLLPKLIKYDTDKDVCPFPYIVLEKLPGENFARLVDENKIDFSEMQNIYKMIGNCLKKIHESKFKGDYFGCFESKKCQFEDWNSFLKHTLTKEVAALHNTPFKKYSAGLKKYITKHLDLFNGEEIEKTILHGDFEAWNTLIKDGKISGIVDFELAFVGHNLYDLGIHFPNTCNEEEKIELENSLYKGYFGFSKINEKIRSQIEFYRNIKVLSKKASVWNDFIHYYEGINISEEKQNVIRILENLSYPSYSR